MSFDSFFQYSEALGKSQISSNHPVILVYIWQILLKFARTPGTLLVFDQILYWFAVFLFSYAITERTLWRVLVIFLLGLYPPIIIISIHLWAGAGMLSGLTLAVATIMMHRKTRNTWWLLPSVISLFYAFALRYNAITGVIPILFLFSWQLSSINIFLLYNRRIFTILVFFLTIGVFVIIRLFVNYNVKHVPELGTIFVWDMAAVSISTNHNMIPHFISRDHGPHFLLRLKNHFDPKANVPVFSVVSPYPPKGKMKYLVFDWISMIYNHPLAYLQHRITVFKYLIDFGHATYYPFQPDGIIPNANHIHFHFHDFVRYHLIPAIRDISTLTFYKIWIYLAFYFILMSYSCFLLLFMGTSSFNLSLACIVAFSGLTMELPLFIFAPAADYRYSIWAVCSAILSLFMVAADFIPTSSSTLRAFWHQCGHGIT